MENNACIAKIVSQGYTTIQTSPIQQAKKTAVYGYYADNCFANQNRFPDIKSVPGFPGMGFSFHVSADMIIADLSILTKNKIQ